MLLWKEAFYWMQILHFVETSRQKGKRKGKEKRERYRDTERDPEQPIAGKKSSFQKAPEPTKTRPERLKRCVVTDMGCHNLADRASILHGTSSPDGHDGGHIYPNGLESRSTFDVLWLANCFTTVRTCSTFLCRRLYKLTILLQEDSCASNA